MRVAILITLVLFLNSCKNQDSKDLNVASDVVVTETLSNEELATRISEDPLYKQMLDGQLEMYRLFSMREVVFESDLPDMQRIMKVSSNDDELLENMKASMIKGQDKFQGWIDQMKRIREKYLKKYPQVLELDDAGKAQVGILAMSKLEERTGFSFVKEMQNIPWVDKERGDTKLWENWKVLSERKYADDKQE